MLLTALVGLTLTTGTAGPAQAGPPAGTAVQRTWHADQARIPAARAAGRSGAGVVVAVLDSWIDGTHPDFEGRVLAGADCLGGTCRPGPARADACDHGTHVAGTVAASSFGVAPKATVLPVRVLAFDARSAECLGDPDDVAAGIRWAVAQGADVLNLSLGPDVPGLTASSSLPAAVREAADAGALVVFSAGNAALPLADSYAGAALVVAATGPDGRLASYSQRSVGVDLAAPGGDPAGAGSCTRDDCVTSLFPADRYAVAAGTSMAAPHVSGTAALLLGQDPRRTRAQLVERLTSTARPLADAGAGLLDASAALSVRPRQAAAAAPRVVPSPRTAPRPGTAARAAAPAAPRRGARGQEQPGPPHGASLPGRPDPCLGTSDRTRGAPGHRPSGPGSRPGTPAGRSGAARDGAARAGRRGHPWRRPPRAARRRWPPRTPPLTPGGR